MKRMNNSDPALAATLSTAEGLTERLQQLLATESLASQRAFIAATAINLNTDVLSCAAALLYLLQPPPAPPVTSSLPEALSTIKMVRYRLDIGSDHQLTLNELKKVLVEESGVDKNNIHNVSIRGAYTLLDLPDAMPADIFQHLKTVEIQQRPLAIKRVKTRHKKRGHPHYRRCKSRLLKSPNAPDHHNE